MVVISVGSLFMFVHWSDVAYGLFCLHWLEAMQKIHRSDRPNGHVIEMPSEIAPGLQLYERGDRLWTPW